MSRLKKSNRPSDEQNYAPIPQETAHYTTKTGIRKAVRIIPMNLKQEEYLDYLLNDKKTLVVAEGPAGCGKTYLGMLAGIKALSEKKVHKLVLCRPAVSADGDEKLGALPGTLEEKMNPYLRPMLDIIYDYYNGKEVERLIEDKIIEIIPLAFMRGRNLANAWVVLDEAQNCNENLMFMMLTRICENSKLIITGDLQQRDRIFYNDNGLEDLIKKLENNKNEIQGIIKFQEDDSVRSNFVKWILSLYT
jgi:phosphate starvation-inducible PhoH-like protein